MTMNRERAMKQLTDLLRAHSVLLRDKYRDAPRMPMAKWLAWEERRTELCERALNAFCADPNAEAIDKLRQAALGVLGLIMLFPIDELVPLERREFWERQIAAAASDLKEGLNATEEG